MDIIRRHSNESVETKAYNNKVLCKLNGLMGNLQNHLNNKVKVSFIPNEYYNDRIYTLIDYTVSKGVLGQNLNLLLKENESLINYSVDNIVDLKVNEYFNRIEYSAKVMSVNNNCYNFCLYY